MENSPKIENSDTKRFNLKWEYETLYVNCLKAQSICNFELLYTDKKKRNATRPNGKKILLDSKLINLGIQTVRMVRSSLDHRKLFETWVVRATDS